MEFYISPQSGQFYFINVLENQWLSVTCIFSVFYLFFCDTEDLNESCELIKIKRNEIKLDLSFKKQLLVVRTYLLAFSPFPLK